MSISDVVVRKPLAVAAVAAAVCFSALLPAPAHASPPVILDLSCPSLPYGPEFVCAAAYTSSAPGDVRVEWSGADGVVVNTAGVSRFFAQCANGDSVRITVKVTNADGTSTASTRRYRCIA